MSESSGVQNKTLPLMLEDWSFQTESNFVTAIGRVTNMTDLPMENVQVVIQFFTSDGAFVKSGDALVEFNPILSGQTSPFTVIVSGNPEIATGTISFKTLFGGTIPSLSRAKVEEEQQQQIAEEDRKRREAQKERDAAEAVIRMELLQKEAPAAWQELHLELSDSLTPKSRDKLRSFVKEYKGTPEGVLAENESKADGMWTLVKQYERIKNKKKSTDLALEIIKDFPETVSAKQAKKWIEGAK